MDGGRAGAGPRGLWSVMMDSHVGMMGPVIGAAGAGMALTVGCWCASRDRTRPHATHNDHTTQNKGRDIVAHNNIDAWHKENIDLFAPPICNKIMYKDDLTIMFIGGPNTREDYHLDLGSEFFFQMQGNMELPTIQKGKRKLVKINEGQVFLLPSRIPHSPQRLAGTFGLVVERKRNSDEVDGLRWYTDFERPDTSTSGSGKPAGVLWDRFFYCNDLEKDLVPVVKAYKSSPECTDGVPRDNVTPVDERPWEIDSETTVPDPFDLQSWIRAHSAELLERPQGAVLPLFGTPGVDHPDKEFDVQVAGGGNSTDGTTQAVQKCRETWLYQHQGSAVVSTSDEELVLEEGCCCTVARGRTYTVARKPGSIGLILSCDPLGNNSLGRLKKNQH